MTMVSSNGNAYLLRDRATKNGRICVFTDVTDRNRAETALAEQIETLQRTKEALDASEDHLRQQETYLADLMDRLSHAQADADETKKRLLRTMSHELKTPLNAIIGFSDLMGSGLGLLSLINQILDLTKIAAGKYELHRGDIRAQSALERAADARADAANEKRIAIEIEECGDLFADADIDALDSMLNHLVGNAVRYTQSGGQVRLSARDADGQVLFSISDNGPGVGAEDLKRILLPFEQAGCKYADHTAGAGLGLTLVLAFAELHGGTLKLKSAPERGFTATLVLPRAQKV
jgi:two-component system cell cycle sensor histidine kinase PleC